MIKNSQRQNGSTLGVIVIIAVAVLLGILGYVAWNNFFVPKNQTGNTNETINTADDSQVNVKYKTVKINDRNFRYPLNKNNERIIIVSDNSTPALQISYGPIQNYYFSKDVSDDCKSYVAGLVNANTEKEIVDYSYLTRFYGKNSLKDALADGTIVQVGNEDLYLSGPFKQNEPCSDIYENKDPELQNILADIPNIRLAWLKSLELTE